MSDRAFAVRLDRLTKRFPRAGRRLSVLQLLRGAESSSGNGSRRHALDDITLDIPRGGIVGVIGGNGAGKTTLLKTVAGLYEQTTGTVFVSGEVTLIAGLGAGMIDELSVTDNIWLHGAILRIRRARLRERFQHILQWADVEQQDTSELRTLSTGLRTRLAFAVGMQVESDVVLIDEAFSSGDRRFQEQCDAYFGTVSSDRTFVIATHNLAFVRRFCGVTLWLEEGRVRRFGPTPAVLDEYGGAAER